jgi:deazaflavin-dependent oxidoreductase (nitroreductase family)
MRNLLSDRRLRAMYAGGRANAQARRLAHLWAGVFGLGLLPKRWVALEVTGRRSGRAVRFPVGMADWNGQWYLVSMLGEDCNWVRNVRAADGRAVLRRRRAVACQLAEVPAAERPAIIRRYLQKVPGGRPHIPVSKDAPLADFQAVSPRYPVFRIIPRSGRLPSPGRSGSQEGRPARKHHWWRWILAGGLGLAAVVYLAAGISVSRSGPPPLALPTAMASAPAGTLDGTWQVASGSVAGFRLQQRALGFSGTVVGRTGAVGGSLVISGDRVTRAAFRIGLRGVRVNGKTQAQFARSLGTAQHPVAVFTLARPAVLAPAFARGGVVTVTATGRLAMHGVTHLVTVRLSGRRDGAALEVAGSIPVSFAEWRIAGPGGAGFFGSLADRGSAEFLLTLHRQ